MNETCLSIQLKNGDCKYYPGTRFSISEDEMPDDNIGGAAALPLCEIIVDGESVGFLDEPPEVGVWYRVEEVFDQNDPQTTISLEIVPA